MDIPIYQVDAFADRPFSGNPAAVCPLKEWLPKPLMQAIAAENNLSETAFFVPRGEDYDLRWFTPATEVELCGHATLASAHVILGTLEPGRETVRFQTQVSGVLEVSRGARSGTLEMDFPAIPSRPLDDTDAQAQLAEALRAKPDAVYVASNYMAVFSTEEIVRGLAPEFARMAALPVFGVIATAPGTDTDFVSRFFAPSKGVPEDPVTGSAHCMLTPYWAERLDKADLTAYQASARGGHVRCIHRGERVGLAGHAVTIIEGTLRVPDA